MLRSDPPSSDAALLAGLLTATTIMVGFGLLMYRLMQPTVLPNTPFDMAGQAQHSRIVPRATPLTHPPDIEQSAIATAARENEIQGLRPALAARTEPAPTQAHAQATVKAAKPKRAVTRAPRRETETAYASNWWGGRHSQNFGGFGNWHRW
jgi:hypothetical protein